MADSFQRPPPADFADHASTLSTFNLRKMYRASERTVRRWYAETGIERPKLVGGLKAKQRPAGFTPGRKSNVTLAREHGVSVAIISRWRDEVGGARIAAADDIPSDFAERWKQNSTAVLALHYHRSQKTTCAWARRLGLVRPKGRKVNIRAVVERPAKLPPKKLPSLGHSVARLMTPSLGHGEEAARYLQSNRGGGWTVYRCDQAGKQAVTGKFWRVGRVICTDAELIERAERRGFDAIAWTRVAA